MPAAELPGSMAGEKGDVPKLGMEKPMSTIAFADELTTNRNLLPKILENEAKFYHLFMDLAHHWQLPASRKVFQKMAEAELGPYDVLTFYLSDPVICERMSRLPAELAWQIPHLELSYDTDDPVDWLNLLISQIKRMSYLYKNISILGTDQELKEFYEQLVLMKDRQVSWLHMIRNRLLSCPSLMLDLVTV